MFLLLYEKNPKEKVLVNLAVATVIENYEDKNESNPELREGIIVNWGNPADLESEDFRVYHGVRFSQVCNLLHAALPIKSMEMPESL